MTDPDVIAAVVVIGSKTGQRCGLFATDAANLGHAQENGDCGFRPDAVYTGNQIEPRRQIAVLADRRNQCLEFGPQQRFETSDLAIPIPPDAMIATGLPTSFDMRDVLCELLDQRQMLGKWRQAWIWRAMDLLRRRRADRDQRGIDSVVLGRVSRVSPVHTATRNCTRDEG